MSSDSKSLVQVASGLAADRYPVWFMRQAGRYLPEYRQVRSKMEFGDMCRSPTDAAEVTLQPLRRYDLDAAIIFSDILVPCMALGQDFSIGKGHGPQLSPTIRSKSDLDALKKPNVERDLSFVGEAIALTKKGLNSQQTMIGFAGAPFTVASYMIEGGPSKEFTEVKQLMFNQPEVFLGLLDRLNELTFDYLGMQVKAGADVIMVFDSWAANLAGDDYRQLVFPKTRELLLQLRKHNVPVIYYPGQGAQLLYELKNLVVDVLSIDWRVRLDRAAAILDQVGVKCALQGNLDPQYLIGAESFVREKTRQVLQAAAKSGRGHIFNVGHGLMPHIDPQSLVWVIDEVRRFKR